MPSCILQVPFPPLTILTVCQVSVYSEIIMMMMMMMDTLIVGVLLTFISALRAPPGSCSIDPMHFLAGWCKV